MKKIIILALIFSLFTFGCTNNVVSSKPNETKQTCQVVFDSVPSTSLSCNNVSYTESVCGLKTLSYLATVSPSVSLCNQGAVCSGKPLSQCSPCDRAMTRCVMTIKNTEPVLSGQWIVGANFTWGTSTFTKESISKTIRANENATFDFYQIYDPGDSSDLAICSIRILEEPKSNDCHQETRQRTECQNVTSYQNVSREVCS